MYISVLGVNPMVYKLDISGMQTRQAPGFQDTIILGILMIHKEELVTHGYFHHKDLSNHEAGVWPRFM